jgi:hypothetical protein
MAEKIQINLSNDQKKSSDEQFLQAPRNWQKCLALVLSCLTLLSTGCPETHGSHNSGDYSSAHISSSWAVDTSIADFTRVFLRNF